MKEVDIQGDVGYSLQKPSGKQELEVAWMTHLDRDNPIVHPQASVLMTLEDFSGPLGG